MAFVVMYVYAGACVYAYVYSKICKFLIYARKKWILQSVVSKMKKNLCMSKKSCTFAVGIEKVMLNP